MSLPLLYILLLFPFISGFRFSHPTYLVNRFKFNIGSVGGWNQLYASINGGTDAVYMKTKPEVLAPVGGWNQLYAAINAGADAVYFGLQEGFNARARASNFAIHEIREVMQYLHDRNKKGYLVINILVFDEEFDKLYPLIREIASSGVDALIMQDLGAIDFVQNIAPNLPVHGRFFYHYSLRSRSPFTYFQLFTYSFTYSFIY